MGADERCLDGRRIDAVALLECARAIYDLPGAPLALASRGAWRGGFGAGASWMGMALQITRGAPPIAPALERRTFWIMNALGLAKNGGAALTAAVVGALLGRALGTGSVGWLVGAITFIAAFYAIEGQMVFLFPLALEGRAAECRKWTVKAGGTWRVMLTVVPISAGMVFGGFLGRGFLRSWCLGCLAVVVWYHLLEGDLTARAPRAR